MLCGGLGPTCLGFGPLTSVEIPGQSPKLEWVGPPQSSGSRLGRGPQPCFRTRSREKQAHSRLGLLWSCPQVCCPFPSRPFWGALLQAASSRKPPWLVSPHPHPPPSVSRPGNSFSCLQPPFLTGSATHFPELEETESTIAVTNRRWLRAKHHTSQKQTENHTIFSYPSFLPS